MYKKTLLIAMAGAALLFASCWSHSNKRFEQIKKELSWATTPEHVAENARDLGCSAALVLTEADTHYAAYLADDASRCFAMAYVPMPDSSGWRGNGCSFNLSEPIQELVMSRVDDNTVRYTTPEVQDVVIVLKDIVRTDSLLTFTLALQDGDGVGTQRQAELYLYGKMRRLSDPLAETGVQQMLFVGISIQPYLVDQFDRRDYVRDSVRSAAKRTLVEAVLGTETDQRLVKEALEGTEAAPDSTVRSHEDDYATYIELDSLAAALGFRHKTSTADGDHMKLEVSGLPGGRNRCYDAMERMHEAAVGRCSRVAVHHKGGKHRHCTFTAEW